MPDLFDVLIPDQLEAATPTVPEPKVDIFDELIPDGPIPLPPGISPGTGISQQFIEAEQRRQRGPKPLAMAKAFRRGIAESALFEDFTTPAFRERLMFDEPRPEGFLERGAEVAGGMVQFIALYPAVFAEASRTANDRLEETGNPASALGAGVLQALATLTLFRFVGGVAGKKIHEGVGKMLFRRDIRGAVDVLVGAGIGFPAGVGILELELILDQLQTAIFGEQTFDQAFEQIRERAPETALEGLFSAGIIMGGGAVHAAFRARADFRTRLRGAKTPTEQQAVLDDVSTFIRGHREARDFVENATPEVLRQTRERFAGRDDHQARGMVELIDRRLKRQPGGAAPEPPPAPRRYPPSELTSREGLMNFARENPDLALKLSKRAVPSRKDLSRLTPSGMSMSESQRREMGDLLRTEVMPALRKEARGGQEEPEVRAVRPAREGPEPQEGRIGEEPREPLGRVPSLPEPTPEARAEVGEPPVTIQEAQPAEAGEVLPVSPKFEQQTRSEPAARQAVEAGEVEPNSPQWASIAKRHPNLSRWMERRVPQTTIPDEPTGSKPSAHASTPESAPSPGTPAWAEPEAGWLRRTVRRLRSLIQFATPKHVFDAENPAPESVVDKLTEAIKKAKPKRGQAEGLKAQERRRRANQMFRLQRSGRGEAGMARAARVLHGEYPTVGFDPIGDQFSQAERDQMFEHIRTHASLAGKPFTKSMLTKLLQKILDHGHLPTQGELALIEQVFGPKVAHALARKAGVGARIKNILKEALNLPRTLLTAYDFSATLRQGFSLVVTNPILTSRAFASQLRAFASEGYAVAMDRTIRREPGQALRRRSGLDLTTVTGEAALMSEREERFMSRLLQRFARAKLKGIAKLLLPLKWHAMGVRASERAYVTFLNLIRVRVFDAWAQQLRLGGFDPANPKHFGAFQELARFVNASTGRGNVKFRGSEWVNATFFAPRFMVSRFEQPFLRLPKNVLLGPPPLRRLAMRQLIGMSFVWFGMAALLNAAFDAFDVDGHVELDPRSSDFLKIRIGNTRIDMGAGYGQVIRAVVQIATLQRKDLMSGKIEKAQIGTTAWFFLRYKLSPVPSAVVSIREGQTPAREKATPLRIIEGLASPISFQSLVELVDEHGALGLAYMVPEILGVGTQVHEYREDNPNKGYHYDIFWNAIQRRDEETAVRSLRRLGELGVKARQLKASRTRRKLDLGPHEAFLTKIGRAVQRSKPRSRPPQ